MMATMSDMSIDRWVEFVVFMLLLGACGLGLGVSLRGTDLVGVMEAGAAAVIAAWGAMLAVREHRR
jgi:hypothetical protein